MEQILKDSTAIKANKEDSGLYIDGALAWILVIFVGLVLVTFIIILLHKYLQGPRYSKKNRINGKVVIITGCNTGIGKQTAMELARRGAKVYMACRDSVRCEAARLEIIEQTNNQKVFNRSLDLNSLASVRQFAEQFLSEESRLDILINNAGIMATPRKLTVDGYEQQIAVNHLGHFLLTRLLLDRLKESAPSRIVVLSSTAYLLGSINKNDLMSEKSYSKYGAYGQSKLANILFTRKLANELKGTGVIVNCCHPGVVQTELFRYNTGWCWNTGWSMSGFLMKTPKAGAQTSLRLALDPSLEKKSGDYYQDSHRFPLMWWAKNKDMADWLWTESEKLVGLNEAPPIENIIVKK